MSLESSAQASKDGLNKSELITGLERCVKEGQKNRRSQKKLKMTQTETATETKKKSKLTKFVQSTSPMKGNDKQEKTSVGLCLRISQLEIAFNEQPDVQHDKQSNVFT